jgi:hypothetical protein
MNEAPTCSKSLGRFHKLTSNASFETVIAIEVFSNEYLQIRDARAKKGKFETNQKSGERQS